MKRFYNVEFVTKDDFILFGSSKIYQYHQSNIDNKILSDIVIHIDSTKDQRPRFNDNTEQTENLCLFYDAIIRQNMDDIVYEMMNVCDNREKIAICFAAIINDRSDIIEDLLADKFDFSAHFYNLYFICREIHCRFNFINYAIRYDRIKIVKYLLDSNIDFDILTDKYNQVAWCMYNLKEDSQIWDLVTYYYPKYHSQLLIIAINKGYHCWINQLINSDHMDQIQYFFKPASSDCIGTKMKEMVCNKINIPTIKLLVDHGLVIDQELYETIFNYGNTELIDYLMTEYHFIPSDQLIASVFYKINIQIIKLLIKHNIDLSSIQYVSKYDDFMEGLSNCNMDPKIFAKFMIRHNWFDMDI